MVSSVAPPPSLVALGTRWERQKRGATFHVKQKRRQTINKLIYQLKSRNPNIAL